MNHDGGTERGVRRGSAVTATFLRQAIERMAAGDYSVPLDELRQHLSRAEEHLARIHALGGRYPSVQMSPHTAWLYHLLRVRRKAG